MARVVSKGRIRRVWVCMYSSNLSLSHYTNETHAQDMAFLRAVEAQNAHADNNDSGQYEVRCTAEAVALLRRAERLYWRASDVVARVFAATNTHRVFSTSHWEEDAESGASYELTTNTPLPWDVRHIEAFLWQEIERTAHSECCLSSVVASQPHAHVRPRALLQTVLVGLFHSLIGTWMPD